MARKRNRFGDYAIRVAHGADKSKWEIRVKKTARAAVTEAQWMAAHSKQSAIVCVFDMTRWGRKPVCFQKDQTKTKTARKRHVPGLGLRALVRRVVYRPATYKFSPVISKRAI